MVRRSGCPTSPRWWTRQEDIRNAGTVNGKPSVLLIIYRQPPANIIDTVDRVRAMLPLLQASIPPSIRIGVAQDRTTTIRASVHDVEVTLVISDRAGHPGRLRLSAQHLGHGHSQRGRAFVAGGHLRRHVSGWAIRSTTFR